MNLPNKLTMLRIILMPVMIALFYFKLYLLAAVVFVIAALTDMLDGKIARKNNIVTVFGKFVDPLADKLINIAAIIILAGQICANGQGIYGAFTIITTVIIVSREIIITSLRALAANEGIVIAADKMGKLKTVLQDIAIVTMFIDQAKLIDKIPFVNELIHWLSFVLLICALVLTIVSGINYFTSNKEIMKKITEDI